MMSANIAKRALSTSVIRSAADKYGKATFLKPHPAGGMKLWRNMSFFMAIPACVVLTVQVYLQHQKEHAEHHRKEYVEYDHLTIRTKRFPWGDGNHTLFHNPRTQWVPGVGYEEDGGHH